MVSDRPSRRTSRQPGTAAWTREARAAGRSADLSKSRSYPSADMAAPTVGSRSPSVSPAARSATASLGQQRADLAGRPPSARDLGVGAEPAAGQVDRGEVAVEHPPGLGQRAGSVTTSGPGAEGPPARRGSAARPRRWRGITSRRRWPGCRRELEVGVEPELKPLELELEFVELEPVEPEPVELEPVEPEPVEPELVEPELEPELEPEPELAPELAEELGEPRSSRRAVDGWSCARSRAGSGPARRPSPRWPW